MKKSQAQNRSEVSVWQKQIDRQSRWIQSRLIRWIPWDSRALPNTARPLLLNPYQIPNTKPSYPTKQPRNALGLERGNATELPAPHTWWKYHIGIVWYHVLMSEIDFSWSEKGTRFLFFHFYSSLLISVNPIYPRTAALLPHLSTERSRCSQYHSAERERVFL